MNDESIQESIPEHDDGDLVELAWMIKDQHRIGHGSMNELLVAMRRYVTGLDGVTVDTIKGLLDVDKELWLEDVKGVEELYAHIGDHVPAELHAEAAALRERLSK